MSAWRETHRHLLCTAFLDGLESAVRADQWHGPNGHARRGKPSVALDGTASEASRT